ISSPLLETRSRQATHNPCADPRGRKKEAMKGDPREPHDPNHPQESHDAPPPRRPWPPLVLAADPSTPPSILESLAESDDAEAPAAVAGHPNTPSPVLFRLGEPSPLALLHNPIFPLLLLENPNLWCELPLPTLASLLRLEATPLSVVEWAAQNP